MERENEKPDRRPSIAERALEAKTATLDRLGFNKSNPSIVEIGTEEYSMNVEDYELLQIIGQGSSAAVHLALYKPKNIKVSIKVIDLDKFERNQIDELRREIQTMYLSRHLNLLPVYSSFVNGSKLFIVTPFLTAGSVLDIMKTSYKNGLEENSIATILKQVLQGLIYLHSHGLIHRDIKAGNVLVNENGLVQLADFGVSSSLVDHGSRNNSRKTFVGTPCWMAPEVMDQSGYDYKADIWSFGITALELANGQAPYAKFSPMKVLMMTLQNPPPTLVRDRTFNKYSKNFKEMIDTCLQKDPTKRPTAEKLLSHPFFKNAKKTQYLVANLLEGLPPVSERPRQSNIELAHENSQKSLDEWNFDDSVHESPKVLREDMKKFFQEPNDETRNSAEESVKLGVQSNSEIEGRKEVKFETGSLPRKGRFTVENSPAVVAFGSREGSVSQIEPSPPAVTATSTEVKKGRFSVMENTTQASLISQKSGTLSLHSGSSTQSAEVVLSAPVESEMSAHRKAGRFAFQNIPPAETELAPIEEPKAPRKFTVTAAPNNATPVVANQPNNDDNKIQFQVDDVKTPKTHPLLEQALAPIPQGLSESEQLHHYKRQNELQRSIILDLLAVQANESSEKTPKI